MGARIYALSVPTPELGELLAERRCGEIARERLAVRVLDEDGGEPRLELRAHRVRAPGESEEVLGPQEESAVPATRPGEPEARRERPHSGERVVVGRLGGARRR